jgi:AraC family transcriptional regulator
MFTSGVLSANSATHVSALDSYVVESQLSFAFGDLQCVQYNWAQPTEDVWTSSSHFLHMSLGARPRVAQATYLDVDRPFCEKIGRVMFVPAERRVRSGSDRGRQRSLQCRLNPRFFDKIIEGQPMWGDSTLAAALHLNSPEVEWFLWKLHEEMQRPAFAQELMVESLCDGLAVALVRGLRLHRDEPSIRTGGLAPWRMRLIRERVFSDQPTAQLTELADLCGMSVRHLTRAFKADTGMTIATFVAHAMVDRARLLLSNSVSPTLFAGQRDCYPLIFGADPIGHNLPGHCTLKVVLILAVDAEIKPYCGWPFVGRQFSVDGMLLLHYIFW